MGVLVALWIGLGLVAGLLAHPARLGPAAAWGRRSWIALAAIGVAGALAGGILGALLLGLLFATAAALLLAVVAVVAVPWLLALLLARRAPS
ncbi:MAG: GlsB/YeaQ/YmgE family stress response membrane protein [Ktedonobacterales bacterium]